MSKIKSTPPLLIPNQNFQTLASEAGFYGFPIGLVSGFFLEKSRTYSQVAISEQLALRDSRAFESYVATLGTGLTFCAFMRIFGEPPQFLMPKPTNMQGNVIGGAMVGIGSTLAKCAPGSILTQVAAGQPHSFFSIAGALAGVFAWEYWEDWFRENIFSRDSSILRLHEMLDVPYAALALPIGLAGIGAAVYMEKLRNEKKKSDVVVVPQNLGDALAMKSWSPLVCGVGLGLCNVPLMWLQNKWLRDVTPRAITRTGALWSWFRNPNATEEDEARNICRVKSMLNIISDVGIFFGARASAIFSGNYRRNAIHAAAQSDVEKRNYWNDAMSFVGGFMMSFGESMADVPTSANDLSGAMQLSVGTIVSSVVAALAGFGISQFLGTEFTGARTEAKGIPPREKQFYGRGNTA